jgi:hypothetical protein
MSHCALAIPSPRISTFELALQTECFEIAISLTASGPYASSSIATVINTCARLVYYHVSGF